jgi:hypothetical protein
VRAIILFLIATVAHAAAPYRLQWRDLARVTVGRPVAIELPSGIKLKGTVEAIEADRMVLDITRTSDRHAYPKGRATVPRAEVRHFVLTQKRTVIWRPVGAAIGGAAGTLIAVPLATYARNEGQDAGAWWAAAAVAIPAGLGYLAGRSADRHEIEVILEEPTGPVSQPTGAPAGEAGVSPARPRP